MQCLSCHRRARASPGAQVPGYPGGTAALLSHNHNVSVCLAPQQYGATLMAVSIIHSGHYFLWFTSPNPATGTSDRGSDLRTQQRLRDRHMYTSSNQRMTDKTKNPNPPVSWPFCSWELHFISQHHHCHVQCLFQYLMKDIQTVSQNGMYILRNFVISFITYSRRGVFSSNSCMSKTKKLQVNSKT